MVVSEGRDVCLTAGGQPGAVREVDFPMACDSQADFACPIADRAIGPGHGPAGAGSGHQGGRPRAAAA